VQQATPRPPKGKRTRQTAASLSDSHRYPGPVLLGLLAALIILLAFSTIAGDDDVMWHLATGRWIVAHATVPATDVFSYPIPHQAWMPFEWGWDVLTYALTSAGGSFVPLHLLLGIIWAAVFVLLYSAMRRMHLSPRAIIPALLFTLITAVHRMTPRPHAVSLLGLSAVIWCLVAYAYAGEKKLSHLYVLPVIFLLWSNLHPGVLSGLLILALFLGWHAWSNPPGAGRGFAGVAGIIAACFLVTLVNPHGISTFIYAWQHTNMKLLSLITEWQAPFSVAKENGTLILYKIMLALGLAGLVVLLRKREFFPALLVAAFGVLSLTAVRFIADFALVASPVLAFALDAFADRFGKAGQILGSRPAQVGLAALMVWLGSSAVDGSLYAWSGVNRRFGAGIDGKAFPASIGEFLNANDVKGRVFNQLEIGGYLLWERPGEQDFIDSRNLSDSLGKEYYRILDLDPGFATSMDRYGIDYFVLYFRNLGSDPSFMGHTPIPYLTGRRDEWSLVYWNDVAFVYVKNVPKFQKTIADYGYKVLNPYLLAYRMKTLDSLRARYPDDFRKELDRKVREEPDGSIVRGFRFYASRSQGSK
jgi:hypothetical protein